MFEITVPSAKVFKQCVDAIATLIDEGEFEVSEKGLALRAMDPSQIAMVDFTMPRSAFEKFEARHARIGVNMEDLASIMSRSRPEEKLTLKLEEDKARLVLTFKGAATRRFVLPLLDIGGSMPKQPQIEFEADLKLAGNFLKDSLLDTQLVSSHVVLSAASDAFMIQAQGDKGEVSIVTEKGSENILDFAVKKDARAMFPLEYLNDLLKGADARTHVEVSLRSDAPLRLSYNIEAARITYFLAPRIETV
jgi:proliferating cell nuclear antigen